jgi:hypothetical protein
VRKIVDQHSAASPSIREKGEGTTVRILFPDRVALPAVRRREPRVQ